MTSKEILNLKVVEIASGSTIGTVTGILIDGETKLMAALQVGGSFFINPVYVPFENIKAIENDVAMVESQSSVVNRGTFKNNDMIDDMMNRKALTDDGIDIGTIHDYDIDIMNGEVTSVSVAIDKAVLGGLWQSAGERFDIPRSQIVTLGDNVIVDKSISAIIGKDKTS